MGGRIMDRFAQISNKVLRSACKIVGVVCFCEA